MIQYHYAPEMLVEPTAFAELGGRKIWQWNVEYEGCIGWLTCVATTTCSIPLFLLPQTTL